MNEYVCGDLQLMVGKKKSSQNLWPIF